MLGPVLRTKKPFAHWLSTRSRGRRPPKPALPTFQDDTNLFVNLIASGACGALAAGVTVVTNENRDKVS